jgi:uroporphyrinogen-III synthase
VASPALDGFVVAVTADRRAEEQIELLRRHGARAVHGPTMRTLPIVADGALRSTTDALLATPPDIVIANTGIGMRAWLTAADSWGLGEALTATLQNAEVLTRGPKAAGFLVTIGCDVAWRGASGRLAEAVDYLLERPLDGVRVALQRDGSDADDAARALRAAGADVVEVDVYRWSRPEDETAATRLLDACCAREVDAVTFTSRPAIENLFALAAERGQVDALRAACAKAVVPVVVGPVAYESAIDNGLSSAVASPRPLLGAMVNTVVDALSERRIVVSLHGRDLVLSGAVATIDGQRIELTPREAAVLATLASRAGAVVSKATLLGEVWGDADADPHALEVTVSRLRRQLGDAADSLETVVRRGYLLKTG